MEEEWPISKVVASKLCELLAGEAWFARERSDMRKFSPLQSRGKLEAEQRGYKFYKIAMRPDHRPCNYVRWSVCFDCDYHDDKWRAMSSGEPPKDRGMSEATAATEEQLSEEDAAAIAAAMADESPAVAKSLKCVDCGKLFKNVDLANYHAEKSGHENFEESTEEVLYATPCA